MKSSSASTAQKIANELQGIADPERAKVSQRFFKTSVGEYAEGDIFLGIRVPVLRAQVKRLESTALEEVAKLIRSRFHEVRLFALFLLVHKFTRGSQATKTAIFDIYLANTKHVNNWDLVDSSAYQIVGCHLENTDKEILYQLAESASLWERRIAIVATYWFVKKGKFEATLTLAEALLEDDQDLIHKAVGWMLREVGNRDAEVEKAFLDKYYQQMPRTMLRYAIEKFPQEQRKKYLRGEI